MINSYCVMNVDGIFHTAPKLFYQSFSTHVWDAYSMKSAVYAALSDKKNGKRTIIYYMIWCYIQTVIILNYLTLNTLKFYFLMIFAAVFSFFSNLLPTALSPFFKEYWDLFVEKVLSLWFTNKINKRLNCFVFFLEMKINSVYEKSLLNIISH